MASKLTNLEQKALEAIDNEALTATPQERATCEHYIRAFRNAPVYADMWGLDARKLRATITKLTGVTAKEAQEDTRP